MQQPSAGYRISLRGNFTNFSMRWMSSRELASEGVSEDRVKKLALRARPATSPAPTKNEQAIGTGLTSRDSPASGPLFERVDRCPERVQIEGEPLAAGDRLQHPRTGAQDVEVAALRVELEDF